MFGFGSESVMVTDDRRTVTVEWSPADEIVVGLSSGWSDTHTRTSLGDVVVRLVTDAASEWTVRRLSDPAIANGFATSDDAVNDVNPFGEVTEANAERVLRELTDAVSALADDFEVAVDRAVTHARTPFEGRSDRRLATAYVSQGPRLTALDIAEVAPRWPATDVAREITVAIARAIASERAAFHTMTDQQDRSWR